jgi:hypothetical protein
MLASIAPPPLVGGGWGEGDRLKQCPAISLPPQPSSIKGEGEKTSNFWEDNPGMIHLKYGLGGTALRSSFPQPYLLPFGCTSYIVGHNFFSVEGSHSWACGPPVKHEKSGRVGVLARHSTGAMVRRTHPTKNCSTENGKRETFRSSAPGRRAARSFPSLGLSKER